MSKIPRIPRETIVLVGAIVGANLINLFYQSKPVQSLDCFQPLQAIGQTVSNTLNNAISRPSAPGRGEPIGGYYDVRLKRDMPLYREGEAPNPPQASTQIDAPLATVSSPIAVPATVHPPATHRRTQGAASTSRVSTLNMTDAEIDAEIARYRASS